MRERPLNNLKIFDFKFDKPVYFRSTSESKPAYQAFFFEKCRSAGVASQYQIAA
ncbi:MAG: hypothetical protein WC900_08930 [Oscillospiraceae bacterium]|jgi:hypothetical protein